jgi:hypothetical protein
MGLTAIFKNNCGFNNVFYRNNGLIIANTEGVQIMIYLPFELM